MDTPVINPWMFYLIDVASDINVAAGAATVVVGVVIIVLLLFFILADDSHTAKVTGSLLQWFVPIFIVLVIVVLAVPSDKTLYRMVVAKNVTPRNLNIVKEGSKDLVDYIIEKVDKLLPEEGRE